MILDNLPEFLNLYLENLDYESKLDCDPIETGFPPIHRNNMMNFYVDLKNLSEISEWWDENFPTETVKLIPVCVYFGGSNFYSIFYLDDSEFNGSIETLNFSQVSPFTNMSNHLQYLDILLIELTL